LNKKINYTFVKALFSFILIFFLVSILYLKNLKDIYTKELNNSLNTELELKKDNIENQLYQIKEDILYLSNTYKLNDKDLFQNEINSLLKYKKLYLDIKYFELNKDIKSDNNIVLKESFPYFKFIIPLFNTSNQKIAYLQIQYDPKNLYQSIEKSNYNLKTYLTDNNNFLLNFKKEKLNFENIYGNNESTYHLKKQINIEEIFSLNQEFDKTNKWNIITIVNKQIVDEKIKKYINSVSWIAFLYFLLSTIISYIFVRYTAIEKENKLREKISNYVFENSHDGIIITNRDNKILQVNKSFTKITGYKESEILNKNPRLLKSEGYHTKEFYKNIWDNLDTKRHWEGEITNIKKDGSAYTEDLSISKIYTEENDIYYIASFVDVTEAKKTNKIIEEKLEENRAYLELINDYLILLKVDINGKILDISDAFCRISGYTKDELLGNNHNIFRHPETTKEFYLKIWEHIYSGKTWEGELKNIKKSKEIYYVNAKISPIYTNNEISGYASIAVDITDKKRVEEMSITDDMTQLYNRRYFNSTIKKEILRAKRENNFLGFAIIDIDFFKQYNDTYGHNKGDKALISVAKIINMCTNRASDFAFRLGGEEFGILVTNIDEIKFKNLLEKIRTNIEDLNIEHSSSKASDKITASFGGVVFNPENIIDKKAYKAADKLLYQAKESGRNRVIVELIS